MIKPIRDYIEIIFFHHIAFGGDTKRGARQFLPFIHQHHKLFTFA